VSSKKDKLVEEAQRLALRGQLDKAIKTYMQVIALDPSAIIQRQRLAELLVKAGRVIEARSEFEAIGKHYSSNGFYLKAIAVYKKLQVMFPEDTAITLIVADLNEKHGLVANALAEYKQVYDYYEKNQNSADALKILEKMHAIDQKNVAIKLKLAEAYFQAGKQDESYATFGQLASLLLERSDSAGFSRLDSRIKELFPDKSEFTLEVLAEQVNRGAESASNAVGFLQALLRINPVNKRVWELVVEAYRLLDQPERVKIAYQHFLTFFPADLSAQKGLIECLVAERAVESALESLDKFEQNFIDGSAADDLKAFYRALDRIDPINIRILQGLKRICEASGDREGAEAVDPKIASLASLSGKRAPVQQDGPFGDLEPRMPDADATAGQDSLALPEAGEATVNIAVEVPLETPPVDNVPPLDPQAFDFSEPDEIEIEIDLDDTVNLFPDSPDGQEESHSTDNWLDAGNEVFDPGAASPRSVKFGSDVDVSDAQSHFDLGVAFREMELFDEAVNEFRQAAEDPERRVACLILQGACLREKGEPDKAESVLRSLLKPGLSIEDTCAVKYDLALACYAAGKNSEAATLLAEIDASSPGFRDVRSRLDVAGEEEALDFSDEDLKGFELK